jgi:hypothetical protein
VYTLAAVAYIARGDMPLSGEWSHSHTWGCVRPVLQHLLLQLLLYTYCR